MKRLRTLGLGLFLLAPCGAWAGDAEDEFEIRQLLDDHVRWAEMPHTLLDVDRNEGAPDATQCY